MSRSGFMIYGAYGYTGKLIAKVAVERGHRPILAGRKPEPLSALARELSLPSVTLGLDDPALLRHELERVQCVVHAAGPFVHTSGPMLEACLDAGTHYLDITGEISVFEQAFARHELALRSRVALIPGLGFDVVPSDSLACFVAKAVPGATRLELAFAVLGSASAGTLKASIEGLSRGNFERRGGVLERVPFGTNLREVRFFDQTRTVMPVPWGDLVTAFRSTAIPNITTYMAVPHGVGKVVPLAASLGAKVGGSFARLLEKPWLKTAIAAAVDATVRGPDAQAREIGSSQLWARASAAEGRACEAWLETREAYAFTAESVVRAVERLAHQPLAGAFTPTQAFGIDFALEIDGTRRHTG